MADIYAVIMAGGRGERFWPLSTDHLPKPFVPLLGSRTLIQQTFDRLKCVAGEDRILVSIGELHRDVAQRQLPSVPRQNFIVEPAGRDTSACLGFCAVHIEARNPDASMLAVPADHYISENDAFRRTIEKGIRNLRGATGVVFGIVPSRPETGYGYVRASKPGSGDAWPVLQFMEKPDSATAAAFVRSGDYFWNSGIFLWENRTLLELFEKHLPETYQGLRALQPMIGDDARKADLARHFSALKRISVDYGILEKSSGLRLVPAEFDWDDIGNWSALERALPCDSHGNVARGRHVPVDSEQCVVYSDSGTVATFGVSDLVVVQAYGRVLVCPKALSPDLKRLVAALGPEGDKPPADRQN
jgi:mannose-1-phosphate guanylyltransferase